MLNFFVFFQIQVYQTKSNKSTFLYNFWLLEIDDVYIKEKELSSSYRIIYYKVYSIKILKKFTIIYEKNFNIFYRISYLFLI